MDADVASVSAAGNRLEKIAQHGELKRLLIAEKSEQTWFL
jgi:hypothetical protein